jgi:hypothetical protein
MTHYRAERGSATATKPGDTSHERGRAGAGSEECATGGAVGIRFPGAGACGALRLTTDLGVPNLQRRRSRLQSSAVAADGGAMTPVTAQILRKAEPTARPALRADVPLSIEPLPADWPRCGDGVTGFNDLVLSPILR